MFGNDPNELDPIAFWVLLLLSGGQQFTFHDLVKSLNRSHESVWDALQTLQTKKFAKNEKSKFMIDFAGVEYLIKKGILAAEAEDEPKEKDFKKGFKPPFFFSTWTEMFIWLGVPFALTFLAYFFNWRVTAGYSFISSDKRLTQAFVWVIYALLLGAYIWFSYHHVIENERLVVFFAGKAIGKRGPGHILLLPIFHTTKKVDLREKSQEIKKEPCLTKDKILVNAGFYITWKIDDPIPCLTKVSNVEDSMLLLSTAILRAAIAEFDMEEAFEKRRALNTLIRTRIEHKAGDWGVQINSTELRELQPPDNVMKSIENRFKSEAHVEHLRKLMAVGAGMDQRTFNLTYLETLEKIGEGASTKYIIPMEIFNLLQEFIRGQGNGNNNGHAPGNENNPPGQLPPGGPPQL